MPARERRPSYACRFGSSSGSLAIFAAIRRALAGLRAAIEAMFFETPRMASFAVDHFRGTSLTEQLSQVTAQS